MPKIILLNYNTRFWKWNGLLCIPKILAILLYVCSWYVKNKYNDIVWTYVYTLDESQTTGHLTDIFY